MGAAMLFCWSCSWLAGIHYVKLLRADIFGGPHGMCAKLERVYTQFTTVIEVSAGQWLCLSAALVQSS
jgi:hypothetical protein